MKHKKLTRALLVAFASVFVVVGVASTVAFRAYAAGSAGSADSAKKKMYYNALAYCVNEISAFRQNKIVDWKLVLNATTATSTSDVRTGGWFNGDLFHGADWNGLAPTRVAAGAIVENNIAGEFGNGKMTCGINSNKLLSAFLALDSDLTLDKLSCNYKDQNRSGIFGVMEGVTATCSDMRANPDGYLGYSPNRNEYLEQIVTDLMFDNNVPGGSLTTYTDAEKYHIFYDTFKAVCVTGSSHPAGTGLRYKIKEYNPTTKKFEEVEYSQSTYDSDKRFPFYMSNGTTYSGTCEELADRYLPATLPAYEEEIREAIERGEDPVGPGGTIDPLQDGLKDCSKTLTLGWIICPLLRGMSNATIKLYNNTVEPFLKVNPGIFDSQNGTRTAWATFRDFANILLVIFILVVIFSQITGVGIDNYGIKKTLPKILVAAILINISFFVAQIAVDLSNILGVSLRSLFENLASGISSNPSSLVAIDGTNPGIDGGAYAAAIASGAGAASLVSSLIGLFTGGWAAVAMALPAILAAIMAALVSIFFFYALLSIRSAAIVLLIALSPLAFACQILPNTKKLFDRWLKGFEGLLLVYPIAGMLMGGGTLASIILLKSNPGGGFTYSLSALLIQVAPFFLLPSILRGSFAALGNIGAKISGFGQRASRWTRGSTQKAVENSRLYQKTRDKAMESNAKRLNKNLDDIAQKQFNGKKYSELTDEEKKQFEKSGLGGVLGLRRRMIDAAAEENQAHLEYTNKRGDARLMASSQYTAAAIAQATHNREDKERNQLDWANEDFRNAKDEAAKFEHDQMVKNALDWKSDINSDEVFNTDTVQYRGVSYGVGKDGKYIHSNGRKVNNTLQKQIDDAVKNGTATRSKSTFKYDATTDSFSNGSQSISRAEAERRQALGLGSFDTHKFVKDDSNRWISADGKTTESYTDDEMRDRVANGSSKSMTYAEAKTIEADANRAAGLGNVASYAGMSEDQAVELYNARLRSGTTSGEIQIQNTNVRGSSGVLHVQRNEAQSANNQTLGKAIATAKMESRGVETVQSVASAISSAESQIINTAAGNAAAPQTIMNETQVQQAVGTGTTKLVNQFKNTTSSNQVGVAEISEANAIKMAENQRIRTEVDNEIGVLPIDRAAYKAAAESKRTAEVIAQETARLKESTFNYDPDKMFNMVMDNLKAGSVKGSDKEIQTKALMEKLASTPYGKKLITGLISDKTADATLAYSQNIEFLSGLMQKSENIGMAFTKKDTTRAQFLRDANAQRLIQYVDPGTGTVRVVKAGELTFDQWLAGTRVNSDGSLYDVNNEHFVERDVITNDNDLIAQSRGAVERMVKSGVLTDDRIRSILGNEQIMRNIDRDIKQVLENKVGAGTPPPPPPPPPTPSRVDGWYVAPDGTRKRAYRNASGGYYFEDGTIIIGGDDSRFTPD